MNGLQCINFQSPFGRFMRHVKDIDVMANSINFDQTTEWSDLSLHYLFIPI